MTAEELVDKYGQMVFNLAFRLTGNAVDAQDLAQDSLVRAIRGLEDFRQESDPGTWVYRITVNAWKNRVRSEKRRFFWRTESIDAPAVPGEEDGQPRELAGKDPPLDKPMEQEEARSAVEKALEGLDPEDRAILVLRELDERSYEDISKVLDLPLGTVKSRISRAREALRLKLKPFVEGRRHDA